MILLFYSFTHCVDCHILILCLSYEHDPINILCQIKYLLIVLLTFYVRLTVKVFECCPDCETKRQPTLYEILYTNKVYLKSSLEKCMEFFDQWSHIALALIWILGLFYEIFWQFWIQCCNYVQHCMQWSSFWSIK